VIVGLIKKARVTPEWVETALFAAVANLPAPGR